MSLMWETMVSKSKTIFIVFTKIGKLLSTCFEFLAVSNATPFADMMNISPGYLDIGEDIPSAEQVRCC